MKLYLGWMKQTIHDFVVLISKISFNGNIKFTLVIRNF